jgi:hypothetical protein
MGTRASIVGHNLNQLIKKSTICALAIMLATLVRHKSFFDECRPASFHWPFSPSSYGGGIRPLAQ